MEKMSIRTIADWFDEVDPDPVKLTKDSVWSHHVGGPTVAGYFRSPCGRFVIGRCMGNADGGFVLFDGGERVLKACLWECKAEAVKRSRRKVRHKP